MPATDRSPDTLRDLGWLLGEPALQQADGSLLWQVDATRQGHTILAWGRTQAEAWRAACRMARRFHAREGKESRRNKMNRLDEGRVTSA
jgi:hypothetical protein